MKEWTWTPGPLFEAFCCTEIFPWNPPNTWDWDRTLPTFPFICNYRNVSTSRVWNYRFLQAISPYHYDCNTIAGLPRLKLHLCWHAPSSTHYLQYPNTSTHKKYVTWVSEVKLKMRELSACRHYEQQEPICCNERGQLNFPNSTQPSWLSSHFNINPKISTQHNHDISYHDMFPSKTLPVQIGSSWFLMFSQIAKWLLVTCQR